MIHNLSEIILWEYQFKDSADSTNVLRRQFLCGVSIKPEKDKELQAFSLSGPHDVISVDALSKENPEKRRLSLIAWNTRMAQSGS